MANLTWEIVSVKQGRRKVGEPIVSIGYGRIALNGEACDLINAYIYDYAEILKGYDGKTLCKIAIRFIKEKTKSSVKLAHRIKNDKKLPGVDINSKALVKDIFGERGLTTTTRYSAKKQDDNTIVIDILNAM